MEKDNFIVSVLNSLGLGVNAMIPRNAEMFASRMKQTINGIDVKVKASTDNALVLTINNSFDLCYDKDGVRVTNLAVN